MSNDMLETRVVKKTFWRILPFLFVLFIIAFLDRVNVGFAALTMNKELGFSSAVYGLGAGIFFIGYFIMEVPGNLIMAKVGARLWIARILITWGLISGATAFVTTSTEFYIVRFMLGVAEASFTPGIIYYLSNWFRAKDQAKALALFLMAMPASSIIGAPISSFLLGINWLGWSGWKWMFVLEAIPALIFGIITVLYLTDRPDQAKWLRTDERDWLIKELAAEKEAKLEKKQYTLMQSFGDRDVLLLSAAYFAWVSGFYGITMFLPTLVKTLQSSMSNQFVGVLVMAPYIVGLVSMVLVGRHSDKTNERRFHTMGCMIVGAIGLSSSVYFSGVNVLTAMLFYMVAVGGVYGAFGPFWSIPSSFLTGAGAAGAIAMINSIGNLGGFLGPYSMGYIKDLTGSYNSGVLFLASCLVLCAVLLAFLKKTGKAAVKPSEANVTTSA